MNKITNAKNSFKESEMNYNEYYLTIDNLIYKIIIIKNNNEITIRYKNYEINYSKDDLSILINVNFKSINDAYKYIINIFEDKKVSIENINKNNELKLILKLNNDKIIDIILIYNGNKNDFIIDELYKYKKEINEIKVENNKLKEEINILKKYHIDEKPDIKFGKNLTKDAYACDTGLVNTFTVFNSINNILYLIYSNENNSIICYDLKIQKKVTELKTYNDNYITSIRHYLDKINHRDIIMSIICDENNIKLWNVKNWELILNLKNVNNKGTLFSGCFLNKNYIVSSNLNWDDNLEPIKIFNFNGKHIKEINDSKDITFFIDSFYDKNLNKNYIITSNINYIKSYDYNNNKVYHKYYDNKNGIHWGFILQEKEELIKLIENCKDGNIRIWNFHNGLLMKKIKVNNILKDACLWNNTYLFVGCGDNTIKLIDLKNGVFIKSFTGHNQDVLSIKKINHPQFGECLISQGYDEQIQLWINKS